MTELFLHVFMNHLLLLTKYDFWVHAQKLIRLMQHCSLNNAYIVRWTMPKQCCYQGSTTLVKLTMLMSIARSIVVRCWQRTIIATMLLKQEPTIVDGKACWWLSTMIEQWLLTVNNCEQWLLTTVVDRVHHNIVDGAAQGCSLLRV